MHSQADQGQQLSEYDDDEHDNSEFKRVNNMLEELKKQKYLHIFHDNEMTDDALDCIKSEEDMRKVLKDVQIPYGVAIQFSSRWFSTKTSAEEITEHVTYRSHSTDISRKGTEESRPEIKSANQQSSLQVGDYESLRSDIQVQVEQTSPSEKKSISSGGDEEANCDDATHGAEPLDEVEKRPTMDINANTSIGDKPKECESHDKLGDSIAQADSVKTKEENRHEGNQTPPKPDPFLAEDSAINQSETDIKDDSGGKTSKENDRSAKKPYTIADNDTKSTEFSTEVKKMFCGRKPFGAAVGDFRYTKGSIFKEEENREIEFKALTSESPEKLPWKIMEKARVFICGILNAGGRGTIYFGIGDSYDTTSNFSRGEVIGLQVEELKDEITKAFQSTLDDHIKSNDGKMKKGGDMSCVKIHYVPVEESGKRTDRYVIEIETKREWNFCKDNVYYFQQWTAKRGTTLKGGLNDLYKVNKDKWEEPTIRTCGSSRTVKNIEVDKDIKEPLSQKYKEWQDETSRRQFKRSPSYEVAQIADVQEFSSDIRESLRELNYKENSYILIANKVPPEHRGSNALAFLQSIPWIAVFDLFDPNSKKDGLHFILNETSDSARATLMELGDFKDPKRSEDMSTRGTTWILRSQSMHESDWTRNSKDCLYRALSAYHERSPTGRIHCVFLGLSDEYLQEMADVIDSCFSIIGNNASRCISVISEKKEIGSGIMKCLKADIRKDLKPPCSIFGFPLELLKENLNQLLGPIRYEEPGATTDLPYLNGKPRPVLNKRLNDLIDLEVYFPKPKFHNSSKEIKKTRANFYMGDVIKQLNLFHDHDIKRTKADELTSRVDKCLKRLSDPYDEVTRHVEIVTLSYESGSGATTLCRRILWDKREAYRCAVVKAISTNTDYQINELQKFLYESSPPFIPPVLVLVDNFPDHQVRHLIDKMSERETKCVILNTIPIARFEKDTNDDVSVLRQLDNTEIEKVKGILVDVEDRDDRREAAEKVLESERRFIWFGLELFGRHYFEIRQRLSNHIKDIISHNLNDKLKDTYEMILRFCCLLDFYSKGRSIYPHPCAVDMLYDRGGLHEDDINRIDEIHDKFGGLLLEDVSESEGYRGWRPAHFLVGEVVRKEMDLFATARTLVLEMETGTAYARKYLTNDTVNVFLQREKKSDGSPENANEPDFALDGGIDGEFGSLEVQTRYSALIMDVMSLNQEILSSVTNGLDLLITLNEKVTSTQNKTRTWQQIARVFAYEIGMKTISNEDPLASLVKRINQLVCPGHCASASLTNGFDIAHLVIDEAIKLSESYVHHLVTKGALFMAKLRDLREEVKNHTMNLEELKGFIQEAINTSKKGIEVYDDALKKTSPDGYLHAMVGKIHTVIVLLEILKRLPFFALHSEGADKSFKDYMSVDIQPENMKATLCQDDLDYFISLRSLAVLWTNDLFGEIKLRRTHSYKAHEIQELTNAKIRAMKLRKRFYQVTGLDRTRLMNDTGYKEDVVYDHLYKYDETPYSGWKNLPTKIVTRVYELLKKAILTEATRDDAMLIFARAALQQNVSVDELSDHVELWCRKCPRSVWAHLFKYMIHFPEPSGSLKANVPIVKSSVAVCKSSLQNLRQGHRKSGAEYLLGKGVGLDSIIPSHKVSKDSQEFKTKFWRSKDVHDKLERLCGQKILGRKGVLTYKEIEIMFDNERYPKESRDDLWFCLGFTVNGPYAYDPINNDEYNELKKSFSERKKKELTQSSARARDSHSQLAQSSEKAPVEAEMSWSSVTTGSPPINYSASKTRARTANQNLSSASSSPTGKNVLSTSKQSEASKASKADCSWKTNPKLILRKRSQEGNQLTFKPRWIDDEGRIHHGAYVQRASKSSECQKHTTRPVPRKCSFAHSWDGDSRIQTVCKYCTENGQRVCRKLEEHSRHIYELGPYLNEAGEKWSEH